MSYVSVVIMSGALILLQQRRNLIRNWSLIGGAIEAGETAEQAAVRETREETGYEISIERFVGIYNWPQLSAAERTAYVFVAHITGGKFISTAETVQVKFFAQEQLPLWLNRFSRLYTHDALQVALPNMRTVMMPSAEAALMRAAITLLNFYEKRREAP